MKRPNLASRNHCILASCEAGAGWAGWAEARAAAARICIAKNEANRGFMNFGLRSLLAHNRAGISNGRPARTKAGTLGFSEPPSGETSLAGPIGRPGTSACATSLLEGFQVSISRETGGPAKTLWRAAGDAVRGMRVQQWLKNLLILVPAAVGHQIFRPEVIARLVLAFFSFSFCASAGYVINDLLDLETDRQHPSK